MRNHFKEESVVHGYMYCVSRTMLSAEFVLLVPKAIVTGIVQSFYQYSVEW